MYDTGNSEMSHVSTRFPLTRGYWGLRNEPLLLPNVRRILSSRCTNVNFGQVLTRRLPCRSVAMESPRSAKRRKLDTPAKASPSVPSGRRSKGTPQTYSKKQAKYIESRAALTESPSTINGTKRSSQNSTRKEHVITAQETGIQEANDHELDVYDDIEGAHAVPQPVHRSRRRAPAERVKENGLPDYEKRKKTLEDEMREIEDAGRQQAAEDDAEETPRSTSRSSKKTARSLAARSAASRQHSSPGMAPSSAALAKRKKRRHDNLTDEIFGNDDDVTNGLDSMDVDQPEFPPAQIDRHRATIVPLDRELSALPQKGDHQDQQDVSCDDRLRVLQRILLDKATGKRPIPLIGLNDEYAKVVTVVEQTITAGESNSMLLIGARGSGKTALVDKILRTQRKQHGEDFFMVRLNGFVHTDDKIALQEIWRQLGKEMDLGDDSIVKNYADTLTTLLALLSHPSEHGTEMTYQVTKSVIFVLDEFELFASHPRQTLLYNLFDIAQSRKAPIAVLGLTTRFDVAESLEKRVKSRFSHRFVHLSLARSFSSFQEICKAAVCLEPEELSYDEKAVLQTPIRAVSKSAKVSKKSNTEPTDPLSTWNAAMQAFMTSEAAIGDLRKIYFTSKSVPVFLSTLLCPLATCLNASEFTVDILLDHFTTASLTLYPPDSKLTILGSLSTLQLALLISAARLTNIHSTVSVNFALTYEEYKMLASKAKLQASAAGALAQGAGSRVWGKEVSKGAWEGLLEMGLVLEDGRGGGRVDVGLEEIGTCGVDLGNWQRWCREV